MQKKLATCRFAETASCDTMNGRLPVAFAFQQPWAWGAIHLCSHHIYFTSVDLGTVDITATHSSLWTDCVNACVTISFTQFGKEIITCQVYGPGLILFYYLVFFYDSTCILLLGSWIFRSPQIQCEEATRALGESCHQVSHSYLIIVSLPECAPYTVSTIHPLISNPPTVF